MNGSLEGQQPNRSKRLGGKHEINRRQKYAKRNRYGTDQQEKSHIGLVCREACYGKDEQYGNQADEQNEVPIQNLVLLILLSHSSYAFLGWIVR